MTTSDAQPVDSGRFPPPEASNAQVVLNLLLALVLLYLFLVGIESLSGGIKGLGKGVLDSYFNESTNPMLGLMIGILATTFVQSSSVTTSLIVGLVASGELSVAAAVPMVMGANIGTTVTNTIASLAHATRSEEFKRAFAAATCHDFFNFLSVATLLPLELITRAVFGVGVLEWLSGDIAKLTTGASGGKYHSPLKAAFKWGGHKLKALAELASDNPKAIAILWSILGVILIFVALTGIVKVMRGVVLSRMERYVNRFLGSGGPVGMLVGLVITIMVQSSSITTSTLVPLAGAGLVTLRQIYPITLGANVGTTMTALMASLVASGDAAVPARQIALVHLLFNLSGILIWYVPSALRDVPLKCAERLAEYASEKRRWALIYVACVFYGLPAALFFFGRAIFG